VPRITRESFPLTYTAIIDSNGQADSQLHFLSGQLVRDASRPDSDVVDFVAARASENLTKLQRTTRRLQQVQFKALAITENQQLSTGAETRFGTRFSTQFSSL
jgi:predicted nucleotidyltransferase